MEANPLRGLGSALERWRANLAVRSDAPEQVRKLKLTGSADCHPHKVAQVSSGRHGVPAWLTTASELCSFVPITDSILLDASLRSDLCILHMHDEPTEFETGAWSEFSTARMTRAVSKMQLSCLSRACHASNSASTTRPRYSSKASRCKRQGTK